MRRCCDQGNSYKKNLFEALPKVSEAQAIIVTAGSMVVQRQAFQQCLRLLHPDQQAGRKLKERKAQRPPPVPHSLQQGYTS